MFQIQFLQDRDETAVLLLFHFEFGRKSQDGRYLRKVQRPFRERHLLHFVVITLAVLLDSHILGAGHGGTDHITHQKGKNQDNGYGHEDCPEPDYRRVLGQPIIQDQDIILQISVSV